MFSKLPSIAIVIAVLSSSLVVDAFFSPTFPVGDSTWDAGTEKTITWVDDNQDPKLADAKNCKIELQTGTDSDQVTLGTVSNVNPPSLSAKYTIPKDVGPSGKVYFFRFTCGDKIAWTTRFTLNGGTGKFPSNVKLPSGSSVQESATSTSSSSSTSSTSQTSTSTSQPTQTSTPTKASSNAGQLVQHNFVALATVVIASTGVFAFILGIF